MGSGRVMSAATLAFCARSLVYKGQRSRSESREALDNDNSFIVCDF